MAISKWKKSTLKILCNRIGDGLHGTPIYDNESDIFFINGNNLKKGMILTSVDTKKVSYSDFNKNYVELDERSLLLSINGTIGEMAFYNNEKVMLGKSAAYLNFKTGINRFYYYYFQLKSVQQYFYNVATGSTIKNLGLKSIQDFEVPHPEEYEWKPIANVLTDIDAKITINNKINTELEAMAKLIYDYWFVQFDFPDANGKPYKSSGGKMVFSEELKREIPVDWEVKELKQCIDTILDHRGKTPKKLGGEWTEDEDGILALSAKLVKGGKLRNLDKANKVDKALFDKWMPEKLQDGDILMTSEAPAGEFYFLHGKTNYCMSQRLFAVRANQDMLLPSYLYYELSSGHGYSQIMGSLSGSTVFGIRQDVLKTIKVVVPELKLQQSFDTTVLPQLKQIKNLDQENLELVSLRDWLLPMLMNGQVTVK